MGHPAPPTAFAPQPAPSPSRTPQPAPPHPGASLPYVSDLTSSTAATARVDSDVPASQPTVPNDPTMPRCLPCKDSKKACDRMRPCSRCQKARRTAAECVPEGPENQRDGIYGGGGPRKGRGGGRGSGGGSAA
ncbi:hypothetical protein BU23DRAFT_567802 [Bimuria novae-zelandiae CBS 107.79]|uniref:Zn(2)-C6 fungal-type domain-containing protein n=1 Tax=Bimuria novae-zelandiae CBS 107.79 TaxID=1447943 RepID=A0A6A5VBE4_9PLEO|nr:hypothetical protein BU23DRAFT_567802 [Bimuria novae-zelandiae CBS 107.79]